MSNNIGFALGKPTRVIAANDGQPVVSNTVLIA